MRLARMTLIVTVLVFGAACDLVDPARPTVQAPAVEKGLIVTVTVGSDAVVIAGDLPAHLEEIDPGTEVVVIPVAGTTRMLGSTDLHLEAATSLPSDGGDCQIWRHRRMSWPRIPR